MQETVKNLEELIAKIDRAIDKLKINADLSELQKLDDQMAAADFWSDPVNAANITQKAANLRKHIDAWQALRQKAADALELASLGDETMLEEIKTSYSAASAEFERREFELKLSGPYDKAGAILSIYAGTGGTDAQDWAEMLLRMYLRYGEKSDYQINILDQSQGEEAGLKSVTAEVNGPYAYGRLKGEQGVHRLVRLSPFNSDNLRQTSFALVEVTPQIEEETFELEPTDLRVDVYRAGGHGGQSVNTTDSAVRLTHLPTGLVVAIQNERSQLQNKAKAMAILRSRLAALMHEQHKSNLSEIKGATQSAAWGNQIRSYVLHPYTKVKDHRTGAETSDAESVLDGELERFIEAYLGSQIGQ